MGYELKPFKQCRNCPRLKNGGTKPGFYYEFVNGYKVSVECECHKKWAKEVKVELSAVESHVDSEYTFDDYRGTKSIDSLNKLKKVSNHPDIVKKQNMFYLYGENGCQKTTMSKALGKELLRKGYTVLFTTMRDVMVALRDDFNERDENILSSRKMYVNKLKTVDFLFIDESFDRDKYNVARSGYDIQYLDNFLRNRFETHHKSIFFISNKAPDEIEAQGFGRSLENFVCRNTVYTLLEFHDNYQECAINTKNLWEVLPEDDED